MIEESLSTADLEADKDSVLVENNAQTIFDHISELEKDRVNNEKRWFWELLQNAKDAVSKPQTVSIKVSLTHDKLTFSHTGNPFSRKDILHLIFHGSSKKGKEEKTGRFGTGFMTTHLLSKKVRITGCLTEGPYFDFVLDRTAKDDIEQKESLDQSYKRFKNSLTNVNPFSDNFRTVFTYDLCSFNNDRGFQIATTGLKMLDDILPIVLAFNVKIKSIATDAFEIIKSDEDKSFSDGNTALHLHKIKVSEIGYLHVATYDSTDSNIAVLLEPSGQTWKTKPISDLYPKLFFDFPLFGTEKLGIPFIINSTKFDPKRERDGIYLGEGADPKLLQNKKILESACADFKKLINLFGIRGIENLHALFLLHLPSDYTWLDRKWFSSQQASLVHGMLEANCLSVNGSDTTQNITLSKGIIPFGGLAGDLNALYSVVKRLYSNRTVEFSQLNEWTEVLRNFSSILNQPIETFEGITTREKICQLIDSAGNITGLMKHFPDLTSTEPVFNWLNSFLKTLSDEELATLSLQYKILATQKEIFVKKGPEAPKFDVDIEIDLKNIAEAYRWDIKGELIHQSIDRHHNFETLTQDKVLDRLERINKMTVLGASNDPARAAFILHLKWLLKFKDEARLKSIYVMVGEKNDDSPNAQVRPLFTDESKKLIFPEIYWKEKFSYYSELVLDKYILHESYAAKITENEFAYLDDINLMYPKPLIVRSKRATKTDLNLLLLNKEVTSPLFDDKGELRAYDIEFSDIPYFTTTDDNILSKAGTSIKAGKMLLRFILFQILALDDHFNTTGRINGVEYSKCVWMARLKGTKWVPYKSTTEEISSINNENPSTDTISALIKDDDELLNALNSQNTAILFNALGLSIADILRSLIPDNAQKLQWDLTFSKLLTNKKIDPSLAQEMLEDKGLQDAYLEKMAIRSSIKRNKNVGDLFEQIFKKIFTSSEMQNSGLDITRTGFGSDYEIVTGPEMDSYPESIPESDFTENNKEVLFKVGQYLIELKATAKEYAAMTSLQGKTAAKNPDHFVLAVLPLANFDINEENVKQHVRFVRDIGSRLLPHYNSYESYIANKQTALRDNTDAKLSIEDGQVRYQVKSALWQNSGESFPQFIDSLKPKNGDA